MCLSIENLYNTNEVIPVRKWKHRNNVIHQQDEDISQRKIKYDCKFGFEEVDLHLISPVLQISANNFNFGQICSHVFLLKYINQIGDIVHSSIVVQH
jgi:hypothetical protein